MKAAWVVVVLGGLSECVYAQGTEAINPLTGQVASIDTLNRRLHETRLTTRIKQEELAGVRADVEIVNLKSEGKKSASGKAGAPDGKRAEKDEAGGAGGQSKLRGRVAKAKPIALPAVPIAFTPPPPAVPALAGVMEANGEKTAFVSLGGNVVEVKENGTAAGVRVGGISARSVEINGRQHDRSGVVGTMTAAAPTAVAKSVVSASPPPAAPAAALAPPTGALPSTGAGMFPQPSPGGLGEVRG